MLRIASTALVSQGKKGGVAARVEKRSGASTSITLDRFRKHSAIPLDRWHL